MSEENVEIVRALQPDPDVDIAALLRDPDAAAAMFAAAAPFVHDDVEVVARTAVATGRFFGFEGLREAWLDWLEPWQSYRTEVEDAISVGNDVVVLVRDYARRADMEAEVAITGAAIWTMREGKVARVQFFGERAAALEAAGLSE